MRAMRHATRAALLLRRIYAADTLMMLPRRYAIRFDFAAARGDKESASVLRRCVSAQRQHCFTGARAGSVAVRGVRRRQCVQRRRSVRAVYTLRAACGVAARARALRRCYAARYV